MEPIKSIGTILSKRETRRDAIHIAIVPVTAAEGMRAGAEVSLVYGTTDQVKQRDSVYGLPTVGVIDPFLKRGWVNKGDRVWLFLHPGSVTGMQHVWRHPAFDNPSVSTNEHEDWLRKFADRWNFDYDEMIATATNPSNDNWIVAHGTDLHSPGELGEDHDLFWQHLEGLLGKKYPEEHRGKVGWSCSC